MTYDLTLRPRGGEVTAQAFTDFLVDSGWDVDPEDDAHLHYESGDTGVYFDAYVGDNELQFSLSFCRPLPFALEADIELEALVEQFDLAVDDPQENGIEGDTYNDEQFLRGWQHGNAFAYRTMLGDIDVTPLTYDGEALEDIWRWNYNLAFTAEQNGGHYVAPAITFVELDGVVHSLFAYPVGENVLAPRTDLVALGEESATIVPWRVFEEALGLVDSDKLDEPLDYWALLDTTSSGAVRRLAKERSLEVTPLALDQIHALEDVEAATT